MKHSIHIEGDRPSESTFADMKIGDVAVVLRSKDSRYEGMFFARIFTGLVSLNVFEITFDPVAIMARSQDKSDSIHILRPGTVIKMTVGGQES